MRIFAAILAVALLAGAARAGDLPDRRPILRIEPGMHTAPINRIGVDAACTLMATGSDDKTARLWALPQEEGSSTELLRTLRVPIGEGDGGKVYAVALSPDGKWVAAGGWDARYSIEQYHSVYVFEAATGRLITRVGRLGNVIFHLVFSPDGSRLAATTGSDGMRLWDTADWRFIAEDKDYGGTRSNGAAFDGLNRLYTVAYDGQIRRYGADGQIEAKAYTQGGKEPFGVAVHPQGGRLAIGFADITAVEVYETRTLRRLYAADTGGISGNSLSGVAWSADGERLYAGGMTPEAVPPPFRIWQAAGQGAFTDKTLSQNTIMQLLPCGGGIAVGAADPAFGLIAADGAKGVWQDGVTADMQDKKRDALTLSADGRRVRFGLGVGGEQPVLFDLAAFRLSDAPSGVAGLAQPKTSSLAVSDWEDTTAPKLNGEPITLRNYEMSRSLAIAPDAQRFVLGTKWFLRAYLADGAGLWQKPVPGVAAGVNISRDGRLVVTAYADGTIRWHRLSDGQELLALFIHAKDRRFIAWTPKGYYAASSREAEGLFGWHVNRGWDRAADFYPVSRFRDRFNRPDIIQRVLDDLDEGTAIAEANRLSGAKLAEDISKIVPRQ